MNRRLTKVLKSEKGQALVVVLILMVLGGLLIIPCLNYTATSLNTGQIHKETMALIYAADAGVGDALWGIKNETVPIGPFDYETEFTYSLPEEINDKAVEVTIQQIWPLSGLETDVNGTTSSYHLMITGGIVDEEEGEYKVQMSYDGASGDLLIDRVGVWLPPGFDYVTGSSSGITTDDPTNILDWHGGKALEWDFLPAVNFLDLPVPPPPEPPPGGGFTPAEEYPSWRTLTFNVSPIGELAKGTYTWVRTTDVTLYLSWDTNYSNYKINSTATDVATSKSFSVESYSYRSKGSLSGGGDILFRGGYRAIGQTLETYSAPPGANPKRDVLLAESSSTISNTNIPDDAEVVWAYLYWSAMLAGTEEQILFEDGCANMYRWIPGSDWTVYWGRFRGHHSGDESNRYLTMLNSLDLSAAPSGSTKVSWNQYESGWLEFGDCLKFQFSSNGGITWGGLITAFCDDNPPSSFSYTIPGEYLTGDFKMRFYLGGFGDWGEYCYIDNIRITVTLATTADTSVKFKVNGQQVYFDELGQPTQGEQDITASRWWLKDNSDVYPNTYSYSCFKDVTGLVKLISPRGNGGYTVGDVYGTLGYETSYAGWSLIIIYSSPSELVHNLYLYDNFLFAAQYTNHTFTIEGFQASEDAQAKLTCFVGEGDPQYGDFQMGGNDRDYIEFNGYPLPNIPDGVNSQDNVWNSESSGLGGEAISGVDIDAFDVSSPIIQPGATWANVELGTGYDVWSLVYIILSFRSNIPGGLAPNSVGSITYSCGGGS